MSIQLNFGRDNQGFNAYAPYQSEDIRSVTLASAGEASFTVPSNAACWIAAPAYQPGSVIWVRVNGTAAAPAGGTFASTTSQLLPGALTVNAGDTISMYNNGAASADISVVLYVQAQ